MFTTRCKISKGGKKIKITTTKETPAGESETVDIGLVVKETITVCELNDSLL